MAELPRGIPTIRLWDLLLVPMQGEVSDAQAERLTDEVLDKIHRVDTAGLIIDVTGLWLIDSHLCAAISRLATASALMGAQTVLCGLSPEIAVTLQTMGVELQGVTTVPTLEDALVLLGVTPPHADDAAASTETASTPELEASVGGADDDE